MERIFGSMSQPPKATVASIVDSSGNLIKSPDVAGTTSTAFKKTYPDTYKGVSLAETLAQTSANNQRVQKAYDYLNKNNGAVAGLDAQMKIDNAAANDNVTASAIPTAVTTNKHVMPVRQPYVPKEKVGYAQERLHPNSTKAIVNNEPVNRADGFNEVSVNNFVNSLGSKSEPSGLSSILAANANKPTLPESIAKPTIKATTASGKPRVYDAETNRILAELKSRGITVQQQIANNKAMLKYNYAKNMYVEEPTVIDNN